MKVLVVDDSKAMRMIVARTLRQAGFAGLTILEAGDAKSAMEVVRGTPPELILSDWNMPGATGLELLKELRANGLHMMFGFVTSEASAEMRQTAAAAGSLFVITKPFTAELFKDTLSPFIK